VSETYSSTLEYGRAGHPALEPPNFLTPNSFPAHQFQNARQQREVATLGMWSFLATEVLLFGGVFLVFAVYRYSYPVEFMNASKQLSIPLGTINTAVLLGSSLTVALAIHAAQLGHKRQIVYLLLATIVLGLIFLGIKSVEYRKDHQEGLIPWIGWDRQVAEGHAPHPTPWRLFFFLYFIMTGLHAVHMIAGMTILGVIAWLAHKGKFSREYYNPVEIAGLYWHFVDIVWVFLLPTLYLLRH
jgi:cytochrome c oxidase subunit 3